MPNPVVLNPSASGPNILPDQSIPVCVSFSVFPNEQLSGRPVSTGQAFTSYDVDFTVKVEATGLKADTQYWYVFKDCTNGESTSPVGRTRTLAGPNSTFYLSIITPTSSLTSWKHLQTRSTAVNHLLSQFSHVPATKTVNLLHSTHCYVLTSLFSFQATLMPMVLLHTIRLRTSSFT